MNYIKIGDYVVVNPHNGIYAQVGKVLGIDEDYGINMVVQFKKTKYRVYYFVPSKLMVVNKKDNPEYFI
jgi:hypothetical protein